jgi:predicted secreted hydrolase
MTRRFVLLLGQWPLASAAAEFALARPGWRYEFPRDDYSHPEFRTEWWYHTGNLRTGEGRRFGFELTFFRQAVRPAPATFLWEPRDVWLAHLALSDIQGRRFLHTERVNRSGPGLAGASLERRLVWNGNWEAGPGHLRAVANAFTLELDLQRVKPPVIHGQNGVSQKAAGEGKASHYVSYTRIAAKGKIVLDGGVHQVAGTAWMDHEFFTHQLEEDQTGWDWFSIQLSNGAEFMLGRLRRRDGSIDPNSHGTFIQADGRARHLRHEDFSLEPLGFWTSPETGGTYPVRWRIRVPSLALDLDAATPFPAQELVTRGRASLVYWEGAMDYRGVSGAGPVTGVGYLEMTGYARR